jgi:cell division septation protein DedD
MRLSLMHRYIPTIFLALPLCVSVVAAQNAPTPVPTDAVFERAQQMVTAGQDAAGRAVIDSVVAATAEDTPRYAEALFWRAKLSKTAAAAERDYRRISVEYPLSPRAQESLLRLAQLEMTRGDRASARVHFARIQREYPTGNTSVRASVALARLAFDDGDTAAGCAAVAAARAGLTAADLELRNQVEYYGPRCANLAARDAAAKATPPTDSAAERARGAGTDAAASLPAAARPPASPSSAATSTTSAAAHLEYSVQLAAYDTRASADSLAKRLSARGYAVRVVGDTKPYRVRVGRYATRERATDAVRQMGKVNVRGIVVQAEPR